MNNNRKYFFTLVIAFQKLISIHTLKIRDSTGDTVYPDFLIRWDLLGMDFEEVTAISEEEEEVKSSYVVEI